MSKELTDLKAAVARIATDVKAAVVILTNPNSEAGEIEDAATALNAAADALEVATAPSPAPAPGP